MAFFFARFVSATPETIGAGAYHNNSDRGAALLHLFVAIHNRRPSHLKEVLEWAYSEEGSHAFIACASGKINGFDPFGEAREQGKITEIVNFLKPDRSFIPGSSRQPHATNGPGRHPKPD
jgi:hypothetical protein